MDQIIGTIFDPFQAQQLRVQQEIQEQVQATNVCFAALAEQMQQLISTTTTTVAVPNNPPTPRPLPATSWFQRKEPRDIYITNDTFLETEPALAYGRPPAKIKLKVPSTDTSYNKKFSCTAPGEDDIPCAGPT
uniref:Uncharacterized protein n=1 Tax=Romanomermis culicivorax TaxID=13658 RepID=A0A915I0Q7_ROMCU